MISFEREELKHLVDAIGIAPTEEAKIAIADIKIKEMLIDYMAKLCTAEIKNYLSQRYIKPVVIKPKYPLDYGWLRG